MSPSIRSLAFILCVVLGLLLAGGGLWLWCPRPSPEAPPAAAEAEEAGPALFRDVTADSGIAFTYRNGEERDLYTILESLGGGVALFDYDGDGLLDLFVTGGGTFSHTQPPAITGFPGKLYRNLGGFRFRDVTAAVGLDRTPFYSHGVAVADFDADGWPDLLVTGYGGLVLYRNEGGKRFTDVTAAAGLRDDRWCTSAAWADLHGTGRADLYVARYVDWSFANDPLCPSKAEGVARDVCPPQRFQALPHSVYRNRDGHFQDVSAQVGLVSGGKGLGVVITDVNADGRPDVYVANDASNNFLYLNRGGGKLEEVGLTAGVAVDDHGHYNGSMGVVAGDHDGSGRPSLFVANFQGETHALYQNLGGERFVYRSQAAGLTALGQELVGFGTAFVDFDNDGWLDLFLVHGHVLRHPVGASFRQLPRLLRNVERPGRRFFQDVSRQGGPYFASPALGRGVAVGDLDNDGWPDLVISHSNSPVVLLRNQGASRGGGQHWLGVQLRGRNHRPVVGATVSLEVGGRRLTRFSNGGGSYLSASDPRLLFGLGSVGQVGRLTVRWPWGTTQQLDGLMVDRYWQIVEGEAAARSLP